MLEENKERSGPTARLVRALLILPPLLFAFCYFLARAQGGSEQAAIVIGLAALGTCFGAAGLNQPQGPKAAVTSGLLAMVVR